MMSEELYMGKEWIKIAKGEIKFKREHLLNHGANNWNLNQSYNVGKTSELIRKCAPKTLEEWEEWYFKNARQNRKNGEKIDREWIKELGRRLYVKLTEVVQKELESITEEECVDYMFFLVINRTFQGYFREKNTVYGQLEKSLNVNIEPAPDKIDRNYNVDFIININGNLIGLQIKPMAQIHHIPQIFKEKTQQMKTHKKFTEEFGGKVFYVFSLKKKIHEKEQLIPEIKEEIERLKKLKLK